MAKSLKAEVDNLWNEIEILKAAELRHVTETKDLRRRLQAIEDTLARLEAEMRPKHFENRTR